MAKKPVRKQAPPKPGERPRSSEAEPAAEVDPERSIEDLVADLGSGEEPVAPPNRKSKRRGKRSEAEAVEAEPSVEAESAADEAEPPPSADGEAIEGEAVAEALEGEAIEGDAVAEATEGEAASEPDEQAVRLVDSLPIDIEDDLSEVEGEASPRMVSIVESLLFASSKPLRVKQIRKVLEEPSVRQIQLALKHLIATNDTRGIVVAQVAGGFVLQTHSQNATWVQRLLQAKPVRLSRPQLETLAVIAYRQPVTRAEVDHIRGVDSGAVIKLLLERELIQIVGKKDEPGRPMVYGTTVGFLEFFNLMSLRDLPDLREFRELSDDTKATLRKRMADAEVEALGQEVLQFARDGEEPAEASAEESAEEPTEAIAEGEEGEPEDAGEASEQAEESEVEDASEAGEASDDEASDDAESDDAESDDEASEDEESDDAVSEDEASDDEESDEESSDDAESDDEESDDAESNDAESNDEESDDEEDPEADA